MSIDFITKTEEFKKLISGLSSGKALSVSGVIDQAKPYFLSSIKRETEKNIVFLCPVSSSLQNVKEKCDFFLSQLSMNQESDIFPHLADSPYQDTPCSMDSVSSRMRLLMPVPCKKALKKLFLEIENGVTLDREDLIGVLENYGYERQDIINSHGEYAFRGGIVDVFSPLESYPFRIEFSGETSVRSRELIFFTYLP